MGNHFLFMNSASYWLADKKRKEKRLTFILQSASFYFSTRRFPTTISAFPTVT